MLTYIKKFFIKYFTPSFIVTELYEKHPKPVSPAMVTTFNSSNENFTDHWMTTFNNSNSDDQDTKDQELDIESLRALTKKFHRKIVDMQQSVLLQNNINVDISKADFKELTKIIKSNVENALLSSIKIDHKTKDISKGSSYVITKTTNSEFMCPVFYHVRVVSGTCKFEYLDNTKEPNTFTKKTDEDFIFGVKNIKENENSLKAHCHEDCNFATLLITEYSFEKTE